MVVRALAAFATFKDSLSAKDVGETVLNAFKRYGEDQLHLQMDGRNVPLSDGGEGFLNTLKEPLSLELVEANVTFPYVIEEAKINEKPQKKLKCHFGVNKKEKFAVIEMARACGIELVPNKYRNPYCTTSKGCGEMIMMAYEMGYRRILMGIGGSATSDGGLGALQAMGLKIQCKNEKTGDLFEPDCFYGKHLTMLHSIRIPTLSNKNSDQKLISDLEIDIACDVRNPFVGSNGTVYVFSGQKGATEQQKIELEKGMINLSQLINSEVGIDLSIHEANSNASSSVIYGAGAAGGIAGSMHGLQRATLKRGIELIAAYVNLDKCISQSDIVFTGEGSYDYQTEQGKVVSMVKLLCQKHNKPLIIICGKTDKSTSETSNVFSLLDVFDTNESMNNTKECLSKLVSNNAYKFLQAIK